MEELELLKQDWKKQEEVLPKLSYTDIYQMMLKKSSSIVKWIFVISILEFLLWASLDIISRVADIRPEKEIQSMETFYTFTLILNYSILIYFIVRFYLNYKKIKATDSTKKLMKNIIRTRKTVKQYIWINISLLAIVTIGIVMYSIFFTEEFQNNTSETAPAWLFIVIMIIVVGFFVGLVALFYRVIYGILLRRLQNNYKELEKLEI